MTLDDASPDNLSTLRDRVRARRDLRDRLLLAMYRLTDGVAGISTERFSLEKLADELGADLSDVSREAHRLAEADLLDRPTMAPMFVLTPAGVEYVEQMIEPTGNALQILNAVELRQVEAFTHELDQALDAGEVEAPPDTLDEIRDLLRMLQLQVKRPRRGVVRAILTLLGSLLVGAGGSAVYDLARQIPVIL